MNFTQTRFQSSAFNPSPYILFIKQRKNGPKYPSHYIIHNNTLHLKISIKLSLRAAAHKTIKITLKIITKCIKAK
jgi:hypothetical protein